jgi:hypothetical protein
MIDSWTMSPSDDGVGHIFLSVFLNSESLYIIGTSTEYLDVTEKKIRTYCDTTVTLTTIYQLFISLYKTLHRKRMDTQ